MSLILTNTKLGNLDGRDQVAQPEQPVATARQWARSAFLKSEPCPETRNEIKTFRRRWPIQARHAPINQETTQLVKGSPRKLRGDFPIKEEIAQLGLVILGQRTDEHHKLVTEHPFR
jgi:hypothetical protein